MNLYAYAGNNPIGFSDPFGLCKSGGPDSVLVDVDVVCPDGSEEKRQIWAHKVDGDGVLAVLAAARELKGGSKTFTPGEVSEAYRQLGASGNIYVFPAVLADGGTVSEGATTRTGGGFSYTAFSSEVFSNISQGLLGAMVGNLGYTTCEVVGHEGVHLLQSTGLGVGSMRHPTTQQREDEAYAVSWKC